MVEPARDGGVDGTGEGSSGGVEAGADDSVGEDSSKEPRESGIGTREETDGVEGL